jgi:hypothetical protein
MARKRHGLMPPACWRGSLRPKRRPKMAGTWGEAVVHRKVDYTLHIFAGRERVAELVQHPLEGSFSVQYEVAWVASEHGFVLAPALPLLDTSTSTGNRRFLENPAMRLRHITFWSILTLLLGNSDAHGKNLSFEVRPAGLTVAPLYDLVSVLAYDATMIDHEFAMSFGDAFRFEEVTPFALADHCERCGIDRRFFSRELRQLCKLAQELAVVPAQDPVHTTQERLLVQDVARAVVQRARHLAPMADAIPRFAKDLF